MEEIDVKVTPEDIQRGQRNDCNSCPVALATNRALWENGFKNVYAEVFGTDWRLERETKIRFIQEPKAPEFSRKIFSVYLSYSSGVANFIKWFDTGRIPHTDPGFTFKLPIPEGLNAFKS